MTKSQIRMRLGLAGIGICLLGVGHAWAADLTHGPLAAAVTTTTATIWARTDAETGPPSPNGVRIKYWPQGSPGSYTYTALYAADDDDDKTVAIPLTGLSAATTYEYTVIVDNVNQLSSPYPEFTTSPTSAATFKFGLLADLNLVDDAAVLPYLAAENPAFVVILGDYDHRNPGTSSPVLAAARAMHRQTRQDTDATDLGYCTPNCPGNEVHDLLYGFPVINVWDDHDYCCNNGHAQSTFADGTGRACVKKTRKRSAVRKMKAGPSEPLCGERLQTAGSCFGQKPRW